MSSKRIKILPSEEWGGVGLFGGEVREIVFKYSVVDVDWIGSSQEAAHTLEGEVVVGISRTLETLWELEPTSVNRVLLAYAGQLIRDKVSDGTLSKREDIQLSTYSAPDHPPIDPDIVQTSFDIAYPTQPEVDHLVEKGSQQALASEIIGVRDSINALFGGKFGGRLLGLPQERSLSELSRPCDSLEEFAFRVASLAGLATSIETSYIKTRVQLGEQKKPLDLMGEFLRDQYSPQHVNPIMDSLQNLNRVRRMYPIHTDRAGGVMSSFAFFGLQYPLLDYQVAWMTLLRAYSEALHSLLSLLKST